MHRFIKSHQLRDFSSVQDYFLNDHSPVLTFYYLLCKDQLEVLKSSSELSMAASIASDLACISTQLTAVCVSPHIGTSCQSHKCHVCDSSFHLTDCSVSFD